MTCYGETEKHTHIILPQNAKKDPNSHERFHVRERFLFCKSRKIVWRDDQGLWVYEEAPGGFDMVVEVTTEV